MDIKQDRSPGIIEKIATGIVHIIFAVIILITIATIVTRYLGN